MSLWLKDLSPDEDRKLAILEPVERTIGKVRKIQNTFDFIIHFLVRILVRILGVRR